MPQGMWSRFAPRMRKTIFRGIDEAARRSAAEVTAEHLLLAILHDKESAGAFILEQAGAPVERVRTNLESRLNGVGKSNGRVSHLSASARRALELADEESRKLRHAHVGTEHLLLGLIVGTSGPAGEVLDRLG